MSFKTNPKEAEVVVNQVCTGTTKEDLVRQNVFIDLDAWTLDKAWSEGQFRSELYNVFKVIC